MIWFISHYINSTANIGVPISKVKLKYYEISFDFSFEFYLNGRNVWGFKIEIKKTSMPSRRLIKISTFHGNSRIEYEAAQVTIWQNCEDCLGHKFLDKA